MTTASTIVLRVALWAAAGMPLPLWAATYKCTVDGKTVYQQAPCGPGAEGEAMRIQTAPTGVGSYSSSEASKMRRQVELEGPLLVKDAYERLTSGRIDEYVAGLCPRSRTAWSAPTLKASLKSLGASLAQDRIRFGRQTDASADSLTFAGIEEPVGGNSRRPQTRTVRAYFERDLGQLCLRALDVSQRQ